MNSKTGKAKPVFFISSMGTIAWSLNYERAMAIERHLIEQRQIIEEKDKVIVPNMVWHQGFRLNHNNQFERDYDYED